MKCHKDGVDDTGSLISSERKEISLFKGLLKVYHIPIINLFLQIVVEFRLWQA